MQQAKFVGDAEEQEEEDRLKVLRGKVARKKKALQLQKELDELDAPAPAPAPAPVAAPPAVFLVAAPLAPIAVTLPGMSGATAPDAGVDSVAAAEAPTTATNVAAPEPAPAPAPDPATPAVYPVAATVTLNATTPSGAVGTTDVGATTEAPASAPAPAEAAEVNPSSMASTTNVDIDAVPTASIEHGLSSMKVSALRKLARQLGITDDDISSTEDVACSKAALIALIVATQTTSTLAKHARDVVGVGMDAIDDTMDADDSKFALIALIVAVHQETESQAKANKAELVTIVVRQDDVAFKCDESAINLDNDENVSTGAFLDGARGELADDGLYASTGAKLLKEGASITYAAILEQVPDMDPEKRHQIKKDVPRSMKDMTVFQVDNSAIGDSTLMPSCPDSHIPALRNILCAMEVYKADT